MRLESMENYRIVSISVIVRLPEPSQTQIAELVISAQLSRVNFIGFLHKLKVCKTKLRDSKVSIFMEKANIS
jgi:hypothetical protein